MTPIEARVVILENAVIQACNKVQFLHNCLTQPESCIYSYPEQTMERLADWKKLIQMPKTCHHSYYAPRRGEPCEACEESKVYLQRLVAAKEVAAKEVAGL
jgi:hypothetical protein